MVDILVAVGTILVPILTIGAFLVSIFNSRVKIQKYYVLKGIFTDRKEQIKHLSEYIENNVNIINVYGKRGIGKSSLLKYYCDLINGNLDKANKKVIRKNPNMKKLLRDSKSFRKKAIYIEISGYRDRKDLDTQISEKIFGGKSFPVLGVAEKVSKNLFLCRKIIIFFDNINNQGLEKEIEDIMCTFSSISKKFIFVVGSVEELSFINSLGANKASIEMGVFQEEDIYEFAKKNQLTSGGIESKFLRQVLTMSKGLPIFVNLFMSKPNEQAFSINTNMRLNQYVKSITSNLDEKVLLTAKYIALLSITNASINESILYDFIDNISQEEIRVLEYNSLIEYDPFNRIIKMHELFRDYINTAYFSECQDQIQAIYNYLDMKNKNYEKVYYLILLNDKHSFQSILISTIKIAVKEENYSFLILIGEHLKLIYDFTQHKSKLSDEAFFSIIWGYVEGLMGVGNYPAAKEVIDTCKISARKPNSELQFELALVIANLYHLQNDYFNAIATYNILKSETMNDNYKKYYAKCLWGIAHSYRHEGKYMNYAEEIYLETINIAKESNNISILLKSKLELMTLYISSNSRIKAIHELTSIKAMLSELPEDKYLSIRLSAMKGEARYLRIMQNDNSLNEHTLLKNALKGYSQMKKRLQYNTYFEFGEYYRNLAEFDEAYKNYNISLSFAKKNLDRNLETMSKLGILLCEISSDKLYAHSNMEEQLVDIISIVEDCENHQLFLNKILAQIILCFLNSSPIDDGTIYFINSMKLEREANICNNLNQDAFRNFYLILM